jgi:hypothetical protein
MLDAQTFLQAMYKEQCDQARQHESMRQQSTTLVLTISVALATFGGAALSATVTPLYGAGVPWVVALYTLLGWVIWRLAKLGEALSLKHYERNKLHVARARQYRRWLTELFPSSGYGNANTNADADHWAEWANDGLPPSIIKERLHKHWTDIFAFVRYLGVAMAGIPIVLAIALTTPAATAGTQWFAWLKAKFGAFLSALLS